MAEATVIDCEGNAVRVVKGAPAAVAAVAAMTPAGVAELQRFTKAGYRTLAIAAGRPEAMVITGLIAFSDPPRADSAGLLAELRSLGVRTVMVTGDAVATAATVAHAIGLEGPICPPGQAPIPWVPTILPSMPGYFRRTSFVSSRPSSGAAMPSACVAMAPTTRPPFDRRKWA
jgi:H+-transporting ATPase